MPEFHLQQPNDGRGKNAHTAWRETLTAMFQFLPPEWHEQLTSTNTFLRGQVKDHPNTPSGTVVAARTQSAGRGRQGRTWTSAPGQNLTFSFLWRGSIPGDYVPSMAQAISVGIAHYLQELDLTPTIKWPNDVQVGGRKISGILCEAVDTGSPEVMAIVAGIGLNVNMTAEEAAIIDQPATSLLIEIGGAYEVREVLEQLLTALGPPIGLWSDSGFPGIQGAYEHFAPTSRTALRIRDGAVRTDGTLAGFTDRGGLILTLENGEERTFYSGDTHLP